MLVEQIGKAQVAAHPTDCGARPRPPLPATVPQDMPTAVQDVFYECLEKLYGGWELNEGSCGVFSWDIGTDKIHLTHYWRTETREEQLL